MKSLDLTALYWNFQQIFRLYIEEKVPDPTGYAVVIVDLTVFCLPSSSYAPERAFPLYTNSIAGLNKACVFEMPLNVRFCLKQAYRWYMTVLSKQS